MLKWLIKKITRVYRNKFYDNTSELIYVHIGKCGGASLWEAIQSSSIIEHLFGSVVKIHVAKPPIKRKSRYLFVVRNPIDRAISAFNWRYKIVVTDEAQKNRFDGEYGILLKYGTLNNLAEALYTDGILDVSVATDFRNIHHLKEDISFYLSEVILALSKDQIFSVLITEFLDSDIERILDVKRIEKIHENRVSTETSKMFLTDNARQNLRKFLSDDYDVIVRLNKLYNLEPKAFELLMN